MAVRSKINEEKTVNKEEAANVWQLITDNCYLINVNWYPFYRIFTCEKTTECVNQLKVNIFIKIPANIKAIINHFSITELEITFTQIVYFTVCFSVSVSTTFKKRCLVIFLLWVIVLAPQFPGLIFSIPSSTPQNIRHGYYMASFSLIPRKFFHWHSFKHTSTRGI